MPGGRPSKLTDALVEAVVASVKKGIAPEVACAAEGVSSASYYSWRKQGQEGVEPYASFWEAITRAIAISEISLVETVATGDDVGVGFGSSKAALELLQRRFPKRWSVQLKVEMADHLNRLIDVAQRVLDPASFEKLLEALADESGDGEAPPAPSLASPPVH